MLSVHLNHENTLAKCSSTCEDITNLDEAAINDSRFRSDRIAPWSAVEAMDLSFLIAKLHDSEFGPGWSESQSRVAINRFKKFFFLVGTSNGGLVPTKEIDWVWHSFVLHTRRYHDVCMTYFGRFIHHNPGDSEEASTQYFSDKFKETGQIYFNRFGEFYSNSSLSHCTPENEGGCSHCDGTDSG